MFKSNIIIILQFIFTTMSDQVICTYLFEYITIFIYHKIIMKRINLLLLISFIILL
jgi:hypothetical protein